MSSWSSDGELFARAREKLFPAVVGDILDSMGFTRQFLPPGIRALRENMVVIGRAMPVLEADAVVDPAEPGTNNPLLAKPFGLLFRALDDLKADEVYVASGASPRYALWGELMSTRARHLGAAGAVVNGPHRDTPGILALGFPTFSTGGYAQDQGVRGKVLDWRVTIEVEGVRVRPGDIVFGDLDGVLVVPKEAEREAFRRAFEKAETENRVRAAIEGGMSTADAFEHFGVM